MLCYRSPEEGQDFGALSWLLTRLVKVYGHRRTKKIIKHFLKALKE